MFFMNKINLYLYLVYIDVYITKTQTELWLVD